MPLVGRARPRSTYSLVCCWSGRLFPNRLISENILVHCVSYDEVNIVETAVAEEQTKSQLYSTYVPTNVQPSTFVTFVYDNCDHNPKTLSGVSMHCTYGIQHPTCDPLISLLAAPWTEEQRVKQQSFATITKELHRYYALLEKLKPPTVVVVEVNNDLIFEVISSKKNFVWFLAHYCNNLRAENQTVPGWSGFYQEVADESDKRVHNVYYLPAVEALPTKIIVVQDILNKKKTESRRNWLKLCRCCFQSCDTRKGLGSYLQSCQCRPSKIHKHENGCIPC